MVDPKNMSIDEILATCRRLDGEGGESAASPSAEETPAETPAATASASESSAEEKPAAAAASGKDPKQLSVAEMLAAARAEKSGGGSKPAEKAASEKPAGSQAAASTKSAKEMSVAEMLAAARGEKAAPKPAAKKPAAKKPAAKQAAGAKTTAKPAGKASPKPPAAKAPSGPKDTASILAAARAGKSKPGPMSKAEAAAKGEAAKKPSKPKLEAPPMPQKPGYAVSRPEPATAEDGASRRSFFAALFGAALGSSLAIGFSSLAVTHLLWLLGFARFMFPNILTEPPTKFKVGFPDEYGPGQVETKFKAQFGVWIVRYEYDGNPEIYALQSVCTHLGCTPNWLEGEQKFKCPCHGSGFYKDGINFEGPAPRPLERFAIRVADDGQLEVDKSQKFFQEKGEWDDPASFVPV